MTRLFPLLLLALIGCKSHTSTSTATATTPAAAAVLLALVLDLNGNGRDDALQPLLQGGDFVLQCAWDDGTYETFRKVPVYEDGELHDTTTDFSWLISWSPLPHSGDGYDVPVLGSPVHFSLPAALGDGVMCNSTDVAILLYYTPVGWKMEHLGF